MMLHFCLVDRVSLIWNGPQGNLSASSIDARRSFSVETERGTVEPTVLERKGVISVRDRRNYLVVGIERCESNLSCTVEH